MTRIPTDTDIAAIVLDNAPDDLLDDTLPDSLPLALQSMNADIARSAWAYSDISETEASIKGYPDDDRR